MKETEFHAWLQQALPRAKGDLLGIGDDAAVLESTRRIAVASDMLVEGVHYLAGSAGPAEIGAKAVNRNFSDMAAMGLAPAWIVVSAGVPENTDEAFLKDLVAGMVRACEFFGAGIVGGDTSRSKGGLVIDVTVIARIEELEPVTRSGAMAGDRILVTGNLGGSARGRHMNFVPRVKEGLFLNRHYRPTAMMDISDGLALDLSRLLDASGKGAVLEGDKVPLSEAAFQESREDGRSSLEHALGDGEDFELLLTLPPGRAERLLQDPARFFKVTDVGVVREDRSERTLVRNGKPERLKREGYDHQL